MKNQQPTKKLSFQKETVAKLDSLALNSVKGGTLTLHQRPSENLAFTCQCR